MYKTKTNAPTFSTPFEQIEKLKRKGLVINDEITAAQVLGEYGYYNVINSYKEPYQFHENGENIFLENTTFEQIYSMFTLDHNLRNSIMASMLDFEEHMRAITAEIVSRNFGTNHHEYLNRMNYNDRKFHHQKDREKYGLDATLGTLRKNCHSGKDPISYYLKKYDQVPPWILLKGTYFSTLINYMQVFKSKQKAELVDKIYGKIGLDPKLDCIKQLFFDTAAICNAFRNRAAHGGRIYNYQPDAMKALYNNTVLYNTYEDLVPLKKSAGIRLLLDLLMLLPFENPCYIIANTLQEELNRHLLQYPEDMCHLEKSLCLQIERKSFVWITSRSNKFHSKPNCSGIVKPEQIELEKLDTENYEPCKRCVKVI